MMMDVQERHGKSSSSTTQSEEEMGGLRRGPWTVEEDLQLINYIDTHGEGRWNSLARSAGLKRTGKSCRLRWLNYLRPDVRRGNITLEEQLMILELHSRWGNRWSKIAQHLPGRTDNEIKNYWRTRVQKHAKQLKCDVNSKQFKDTIRYLWMPRLVERIQASAAADAPNAGTTATCAATNATPNIAVTTANSNHRMINNVDMGAYGHLVMNPGVIDKFNSSYTPENSSTAASSDSFETQVSPVSDLTNDYYVPASHNSIPNDFLAGQIGFSDSITSPCGYFHQGLDFQAMELNNQWLNDGDTSDNLWNVDDMWFLDQQLNSSNM